MVVIYPPGEKNNHPALKKACVFYNPRSPRLASLSSEHDPLPSLEMERHPPKLRRVCGSIGWNQRSLRGLQGGPRERRAKEEANPASGRVRGVQDLGITVDEQST